MKARMFFPVVFTFLVLAGIAAASNPVAIEAPIDKVTVFPDRAQVTRTANLNLNAGMHFLTIENLPIIVDANSFSISAAGVDGVTLLGLNHSVASHLEDTNEKAAVLERRIKDLDRNVKQSVADRLESFSFQKDFLESIKEESGRDIADQLQTLSLDVPQWKEAYVFIGKALRDVNDSIRLANMELEDVDNRLRQLRDEMILLQRDRQYRSRTVEISLSLEKAGPVDLSLTYMINEATWKPLYDARLLSATDRVELGYYAEVSQGTGEDWNDVDLTLSTAMPAVGTSPGEFMPWYLSIIERLQIRGGRSGESSIIKCMPVQNVDLLMQNNEVAVVADMAVAVINSDAFKTTFRIKNPATIPSDEKAVKTHIAAYTLEGTLSLLCRPRNNADAFRLASVTNQDEAPLMSGEVSIFADSDYLGRAEIRGPIVPGQPFKLFFGKDNQIKVEREILSQKKEDKGDNWRHDQTIKITLTNNDKKPRRITVEEPMPVSQDGRVKAKLYDVVPEPNSIDEKGMATWVIGLAPGEKKEVLIPLRIEYPKDANITGL
ncbi:MAG: mucoidy inhibitor MuiA family protein [Candidatus Zixiibacteriota bacterium]